MNDDSQGEQGASIRNDAVTGKQAKQHTHAIGGLLGRSRAQRRSPIIVRGRLLELRRRARPLLPSTVLVPAKHGSPHLVGHPIVRRRPHHPR
eukprot:scaffold72087_cov55-Phaeocystis_antarctica.AAC.4